MVYITGDMHGDLSPFQKSHFQKNESRQCSDRLRRLGFIWDGSHQEKQNLKKLRENAVYHCLSWTAATRTFDILEQSFRTVRWRGGRAHLIAPNIFHMMRGGTLHH